MPRHTKVPLSSTNLKGRLHRKVRGLARGVFWYGSGRQMLFGLWVNRRDSAVGGLVVADDLLATKVAWRRKEGKYKVGVISTPYNSNPNVAR